MSKERNPGTVSLGNVTVPAQPVTEGVQKSWRGHRTDNITLPAGSYIIDVNHADPAGGTVSVNGQEMTFGGQYNAQVQEDKSDRRQDFVEAVDIVANGTKYWLRVSYPADHPFIPSTLD